MEPNLMWLILFAAFALGVAAIFFLMRDLAWGRAAVIDSRLGDRDMERSLGRLPLAGEEPTPRGITGRIDYSFGRLISGTGLDLTAEAAFLLALFIGLAAAGMLFFWQDSLLPAIGGMLAGMLLVYAIFIWLRVRRIAALREQLPDVMDVMARAVRAGESLDQAIALVGETSPEPLGREFRRAARQLEMGLSMDAAMRALHRRVPLTEMRILAAALTVQRKTGGNLPLTLERMAAVVRDRLSYYRQFRASTAASRLGAILIAVAGPLVVLYMLNYQQAYISRFWELPHGLWLLGAAVVLEIVGIIWVFSLLRSDY